MHDTAVLMDPGMIMVLDGDYFVFLQCYFFFFLIILRHRGCVKKPLKKKTCLLEDVRDRLLTQEMCDIAVRIEPWFLRIIPDYFKLREMCDKVVAHNPYMLEHIPDWFVTQQEIWPWDDDYHDEFIKWYEGYQKRKAQKEKIEEELMRIAWHPSRWWDWCVPDDVKT